MNTKLKTLSLCAVAAGILFLVLGLHARSERKELEARGISTAGKVVNAEIQPGGKGKRRHVITVDWLENDVRHLGQKFVVRDSFFRTDIVGREVVVRYLPGDAASAMIVGGTSDFGGMEWLGAVIGLVGLFGTWRTFFSHRKR